MTNLSATTLSGVRQTTQATTMANTPTFDFALGVLGLPILVDELVRGGLYSIKVDAAPSRINLIAQSLIANLSRGIHCSLITPLPAPEFLSRCNAAFRRALDDAIKNKTLLVFTMMGDYAKNIFRFGPEQFLKELKHFGVQDNSYLICDQSDSLFTMQDQAIAVDQAKIYRQWMQETNCTSLFLFLRTSGDNNLNTNYLALTDYFTGATNFSLEKDVLELGINFWRSPEGTVAARTIPLMLNAKGMLQAADEAAPEHFAASANWQASPNNRDQLDIYYMGDDLEPVLPTNSGRRKSNTSLVGIMHDTQDASTATVILTYSKEMELRQLAETVHTLRLKRGNYVRIIVREKGIFLRYYNELLLLRLGANLVIHENVALSRIPLLIESLKGQVFRQELNIDFEQAISSILPSRKKGYLTPAKFCEEVHTVLLQAQSLAVPCVLAKIRHPDPQQMLESIKRFNITRSGDLITADNDCCYLFLHACPELNFRDALNRLMGKHSLGAEERIEYYADNALIETKLDSFKQLSSKQKITDFSNILPTPEVMSAPVSAKPVSPAEPIISSPASPVSVTTYAQAVPVVTRPTPAPTAHNLYADQFIKNILNTEPVVAQTAESVREHVSHTPPPNVTPYYRAPAPRAHRKRT
jgi:cellulose biosynthesis protein BcsE